jgi:hypothetical protein
MDEQMKKACENVVKNEFPQFIQMLEQNLDFKRWGFTRVFSGVGKFSPIVIYASEACRVMFAWELPDIRDGIVIIRVHYGRSHAPNHEDIITWKGQECYCWHDVEKALYFLDGLSPSEAVKNKFKLPKVMEQFRNSSVKKGWTQPEYMAKTHSAIWEHYGQRLFDLFDLRQPSLWEQYSRFLAEYQTLRQEFSLSGLPTPDKVC